MIQGIGVDIVQVERIEKILNKSKEGFLNKVFTTKEIEYIRYKNENHRTIGGMFASKEAVSKVFGTGIGKVGLKEIEIDHDEFDKPIVNFNGKALELMKKKGIENIHLSISHEKEYAVAVAVGEGKIHFKCDEKIKALLPKREKNSHKGTYGRIGIIAGSSGMTGAPCLASQAALRSGSGLVYTIVPKSLASIVSIKLTEAIVVPVEDCEKGYFSLESIEELMGIIENLDAVGLGPGLGVNFETNRVVEEILKGTEKPIVLDADGLNCISQNPNILVNRKNTIITPHPGELSRLVDINTCEIQKNREKYCKETSQKYNIITVLKGSNTLVSTESGEIYMNHTGNPGMATAGSGDVLTGMITSFIGQGIEVLNSAILGVYCHGLAGDLAEMEKGEYGLIARDIIEYIPQAIKTLQVF